MDKRMLVLYGSALLSALRQEDNAPSGTVYAAFMTQGITFAQYTELLGILTAQGLIRQHGNRLSLTESGKQFAAKIDSVMMS